MVAVVILMSFFSKLHLQLHLNDDSRNAPVSSQEMTTMFGRTSFYSMYIVNIVTNQGPKFLLVPLDDGFISFRLFLGLWGCGFNE